MPSSARQSGSGVSPRLRSRDKQPSGASGRIESVSVSSTFSSLLKVLWRTVMASPVSADRMSSRLCILFLRIHRDIGQGKVRALEQQRLVQSSCQSVGEAVTEVEAGRTTPLAVETKCGSGNVSLVRVGRNELVYCP